MGDWTHAYQVTVALLSLSYAVRTILFLGLRPDSLLEWATTAASATMLGFFGVLTYWLDIPHGGPRPVIYPPLVVAAALATVASVVFTVEAVQDWVRRRHASRRDIP